MRHVDAGRFVGAAGGTHNAGNRVGKDEADNGGDNACTECRVEREGGERWISWAGWPSPSFREARVEAPRPNRPHCHDDAEDGHTVAGGGELFDAVVADEVGVHHVVDAGDGEAECHGHAERK